MINGGYGIKNPTYTAPKASDTPDIDGRPLLTEHEPRHDKTNKVTVRPAKTQISLGAQSLCWFCHVAAHIMFVSFTVF